MRCHITLLQLLPHISNSPITRQFFNYEDNIFIHGSIFYTHSKICKKRLLTSSCLSVLSLGKVGKYFRKTFVGDFIKSWAQIKVWSNETKIRGTRQHKHLFTCTTSLATIVTIVVIENKNTLHFFYLAFTTHLRVWASSFFRFRDHTKGHTTVGRTPLDEWSACRRDLYMTTHTILTTQKH
jgi:hypothetical protein